jgi:predicted Rossmann fold flavoprotein
LNKTILIIGAGASGLFASILLAQKKYKVTILEKNTKVGRKILASGNGKCNITNQNLALSNFHSSQKNFFNYAIEQMPYQKIKQYFSSLGLEMINGEGTRMYPMSMQASSVRDILYYEALRLEVKFELDTEILKATKTNNIFELVSEKQKFKSNYLIIATGSTAMKKLGASSSGYKFAKNFGHDLIPTSASLVQLKSDDKSIYFLSGVKIKSKVKLFVDKKSRQEEYADILFTKYGVSGNTILDLSRLASKSLMYKKEVYIVVDMMPQLNSKELYELLLKRKQLLKTKEIHLLLESIINTKIIHFIYKRANIHKDIIDELNKNDLNNIIYMLKNLTINISDTNGEENAEVCAGGVAVNNIDSKTMQSKKVPGLYFIGEVLDVDGSCGGYNFHWAWSSASVCANSFKK